MGGTVQRIVNLGGGRGHLREFAAMSLHRVDKAIGHRAQTTETLRSWSQQDEHYQRYLRYGYPIALSPNGPPKGNGPSIHQLGEAVDSDELQAHIALMEDHGFFRTVYRWVGGVWTLVERWHFEYFADRDNHRHEIVTLVQTASGAWHLPDPLEGGGNLTPEIPKNESEEDAMTGRFIYTRGSDGKTVRVVHGEGYFEEHADEAIKNREINISLNLPPDAPWASVPESYRDNVYRATLAVRTRSAGSHRPPAV